MGRRISYDVRCDRCGWTGDREDYLDAPSSRCPDCGFPGVMLDRSQHPETFVD